MANKVERVGQGPGRLGNEHDKDVNAKGFTSKDLHRMMEPKPRGEERGPAKYTFSIFNETSYRTVERVYHDEEDEYNEIP